MKKALRLPTIYIALSVTLLFARPGYDLFSAWIILLSGTTGSLLLTAQSISDILYSDLSHATHFNPEAALVCVIAFALWGIGFTFSILCGSMKHKQLYRSIFASLWIIGSIYNIFWFGIRSV